MSGIKWRFAFDGREEAVSQATGIDFSDDPGVTVQSGAEDADINVIVRRFGLTGQMPEPRSLAQYGDFTGVTDYQTALNQVMEAQDSFMSLPADVRKRFDNDPAKLYEFVHDDSNLEEARTLGLLKPLPPPVEPQLVRVVSDPPPDPTKSASGQSGGN